jgi:hypothetical protein
MVTFAQEVPTAAQLVVRSNSRTKVLYVLLVAVVGLEVVLVAAVVALAIWSGVPAFLGLVPLFLFQGYFMTLIVREYQGLLGPQLAADHTGVWIRTGSGRRPEVVFLPWAAVTGIDVSGPALRVMSGAGERLFGKDRHWRVRSVWKRFGTPFVVDGRRSAEPPEQIAHRLHQLAVWARG